MVRLDIAFEHIRKIDEAQTPEAVCRELLSVTGQFGLTKVLSCTVPKAGHSDVGLLEHVFLVDWPQDWMEHHIGQGYMHVDPVVQRTRSDFRPFEWREAPIHGDQAMKSQRVMDEACDFKLNAGYCVPVLTESGTLGVTSLSGEWVELSPHGRGLINLLSSYALNRAISLKMHRIARLRYQLTPREVECMRWAAEGKTDWEISMILGISEHTAARHLVNARDKLGAGNRVQAVAMAIRVGIIS